jgi:hypothetical protein
VLLSLERRVATKMGREDQIEEREVLDSIFPDEITDVSETEYRVAITLDVTQPEEDKTEMRKL